MRQHTASNTYTLDLSDQLEACRVHPTFYVGLLQAHEPNNNTMFLRRDAQAFYDIGNNNKVKWVVDELLAHRWKGTQIEFLVRWNLGNMMWEPYAHCKELEALDRYLKLHRAALVKRLPWWQNTMHNKHGLCERPEGNPSIDDERT